MATRHARTALYIGATDALSERARRIVVAAGFEWEAVAAPDCGVRWRLADVVLINAADAELVMLEDPVRRGDVLVLAESSVDQAVWQHCVSLGVEDVVLLDESEPWLVDRLGVVGGGVPDEGMVIGVIGASGGCGASTLAAGLAVATSAAFGTSMIIDLNGFGGGYDLQFGAADWSGLSWHELADISGRISGGSLREAVPSVDDIAVVGFARDSPMCEVPDRARRAVLLGARQAAGLTVVDIPTAPGTIREVRPLLDQVVVAGTADIRGALATRGVLRFLRELEVPSAVAVRAPGRQCLSDDVYLEVVDCPDGTSVWWLSEIRAIDRRIRSGDPVVRSGDRFVGDCLELIDGLQETRTTGRPRRLARAGAPT
ncbi:secretion/DNA translocation related CpaE-like protein [Antricoccus suffuscus]|uniref:Secretion/DNA translocation related CpaE-like protein n=2 Tax=Antricoccus suffuscus TaxID=1629062 RepID=A0A2T1A458_9ACTN|nr:secretion/DNA translocation related CpaE-like protein [Antricoccus suffuscus]